MAAPAAPSSNGPGPKKNSNNNNNNNDPSRMCLPRGAAEALALPRAGLSLDLHVISFSHYCARAKWYLGACGLRLDAVHALLPVEHVPHMIALLKRFRAQRCAPTASSNSPAATPALAVYRSNRNQDGKGERTPLCLIQDSELIGRWAALRAQALGDGGAAARALYGPNARLSVAVEEQEQEQEQGEEKRAGGDDNQEKKKRTVAVAVLTYDGSPTAAATSPAPADLERRLSGVLGVESRRLAYFHLLPARGLMLRLAALNAPPDATFFSRHVATPLWALAAALALPGLLKITAPAVERGTGLLDAEFDCLDALVRERGCLVVEDGKEEGRVAAFLCGGKPCAAGSGPSAADISLAALASPLVGDFDGYGARLPPESELPDALRRVLRERYMDRPTARYARALWREYGAAAVAAATGAAGGGAPVTAATAAPRL